MIEKETIDKIFDTVDIIEVVSDFVSLKKRGVNYLGNCPFHNEKTPSFTVSPAKGIYKCFGCGKGGNSINFIMEHEQLSYVETLKWLAKKYNIPVIEKEQTPEEKEQKDARESMLIVSGFAQKIFTQNLTDTQEGKAIGLKYFTERGFNQNVINKFQLGYCRKTSDSFTSLAINKGYKETFLIKTGLSIKSNNGSVFDRFSERVMFPIHNLMGRVVGFGGRTLRTDKKTAKYLNSPESEIYHKSRVLYGIYFAKKSIIQENKCYLVEGYTDVISMHQAGIENVVASSGTSLTVEQIRLIRRFTPNITVLYDGDAAGIKAALRGIDMVLEEGLNVKVVLLPEGEDPDSYAQNHSATEFADFINQNETDFISFKTKLLLEETNGDPVKKANLVQEVVRTISVIPDGIVRALYVKDCAELIKVDENILHSEINKILYKKKEQKWKRSQNTVKDFPQEIEVQQVNDSNKYELYEKELMRLLLVYGNKVLFYISETEDAEAQEVLTAQYIIDELEGEIEIKTPVYKLIFDEYKRNIEEGKVPNDKQFINHESHIISKEVANMLSFGQKLDKIWTKDGAIITTEKDNLKLTIDKAINGYKYEIVMNILHNIEKELQKNPNDDKLYDKYMAYTQFKMEIAKILGDRIVLK